MLWSGLVSRVDALHTLLSPLDRIVQEKSLCYAMLYYAMVFSSQLKVERCAVIPYNDELKAFIFGLMFVVDSCRYPSFKGSMDDVAARALASHQCGLGSIPAQCHMWVEFVFGSCLVRGFFSGYSGFSPP